MFSGDLNNDLKQVIDQYLNGGRHRSLATLARSSGVSYTTLRRLALREGQPTAEPALKVIDAVLGGAEKIKFINLHFPEIGKTIGRFGEVPSYDSEQPISAKFKQFCSREPHNYILNLAINAQGTSREDISRLCGSRGISALEELLEHEILSEDMATGHIKYAQDSMVWLDPELILNQILHSVHHFDHSLIGTKMAKLCHMAAAINQDGLVRIHDILTDAINAIIEVKDDPRYAGNVHFFVDLMMNLYDKSTVSPGGPKNP